MKTTETEVVCWACGSAAFPDDAYSPAGLYRCSDCGFLFDPSRRTDALKQLYTEDYFLEYGGGDPYELDPAQRRYEAKLRIALLQEFCRSGSLLEIGCATGYFLDAARREGFTVHGIEPVGAVAEQARALFGLEVEQSFIEDTELPPDHFDAICGWHVVEHLSDPKETIVRLSASLRPGGHFLIEVPNIDALRSRRQGYGWRQLDLAHHVGHYNERALSTLLERAGLEVVRAESFPLLGYVRPRHALSPLVAGAQVREVLTHRTRPRRPHPWKHECLRVIARKPAA
jgi:SAM-dependent methyltransferase